MRGHTNFNGVALLFIPLLWLNAKFFGCVTGLKNSFFNAIKVFKTNVMRSQRNGKDNTKIKYCRWVAGRKLTKESIVANYN